VTKLKRPARRDVLNVVGRPKLLGRRIVAPIEKSVSNVSKTISLFFDSIVRLICCSAVLSSAQDFSIPERTRAMCRQITILKCLK
jgi:hypothetical protein